MSSAVLSEQDRSAYEILMRGTLRDVVRAQAHHAAQQSDASEAALAVAARNARTIDRAADAVGITPDSLSLRSEDQASVHVTRETIVALRELAAVQRETPAARAGALDVQLVPEGHLGNMMNALLNNEAHNFKRELEDLQERDQASLRPAVRILLLGADRDLARAQLAVAQGAPVANTQQAERDFTVIASAAHGLGIDPREISPQTPAEVHVTREKVVALRELEKLRPGYAKVVPIPIPSQGPLAEVFNAMQNENAGLPDFKWYEADTSLRAQAEMLLLGARRDAVKAEVAVAAGADPGIQERANRDDALMTKLAEDIGIVPARIKPDTAGKAHVTRELLAASQDLPPDRRAAEVQAVNTGESLDAVFRQLARSAPEAGTGKAASRG